MFYQYLMKNRFYKGKTSSISVTEFISRHRDISTGGTLVHLICAKFAEKRGTKRSPISMLYSILEACELTTDDSKQWPIFNLTDDFGKTAIELSTKRNIDQLLKFLGYPRKRRNRTLAALIKQ